METKDFSLVTAAAATYEEVLNVAKENTARKKFKDPENPVFRTLIESDTGVYSVCVSNEQITHRFYSSLVVFGLDIFKYTNLNLEDFLTFLGVSKESIERDKPHKTGVCCAEDIDKIYVARWRTSYKKLAAKIDQYKGCDNVWQEIVNAGDSGPLLVSVDKLRNICKSENGNHIAVYEIHNNAEDPTEQELVEFCCR